MKISIIIPVYNVAPYLRECLDSVLSQTYTDWEAICVDDGSTDGSGEILDEYAEGDTRFKIVHQDNAGVSVARNRGLDCVSGEWLTFLDGDDVLAENAIAYYTKQIENYSGVDAFFYRDVVLLSDERKLECTGTGNVKVFNSVPTIGTRLWGETGINGRPYLRVLRSAKFRTVYFPPNIHMMEDKLNLLYVLAIPAIWASIDMCVYGYRDRSTSLSHAKDSKRAFDVIETFRLIANGCRNLLHCDKVDFERYWKDAAGVLECYLSIALSTGAKTPVALKSARTALEIERISGVDILNPFDRLRCRVVTRFNRRVGFGIISIIQCFCQCGLIVYRKVFR